MESSLDNRIYAQAMQTVSQLLQQVWVLSAQLEDAQKIIAQLQAERPAVDLGDADTAPQQTEID